MTRLKGEKSGPRNSRDEGFATVKKSIDLASYALTDAIVIDALNEAERRSVAIRIVLDPRKQHDIVKLVDLSDNARIKRGGQ